MYKRDLLLAVTQLIWIMELENNSVYDSNVKGQNGCLRRPYKQLWKEEKRKAKEKRKDIPIWMQSSKEEQEEIWKPFSVIIAKK